MENIDSCFVPYPSAGTKQSVASVSAEGGQILAEQYCFLALDVL
jgi:hypothetical protein